MNLLVMENLFYDRRFTKVSIACISGLSYLDYPNRFMIWKDLPAIVMFNPQGERMKFFWMKI